MIGKKLMEISMAAELEPTFLGKSMFWDAATFLGVAAALGAWGWHSVLTFQF